MKIIKFIVGTIISIVALAIATKLAALILGIVFTLVGIVFFLLKVALIVAIALFIFWVVSKVLESTRKSESF